VPTAAEPPAPSETEESSQTRWWRTPLLVLVLFAAVFAFFLVRARLTRKERASQACFQAMFSRRLAPALEALSKYREFAEEDIPAAVKDELFKLAGNADYPLYSRQADKYFLERVVFFSRTSDHALARAKNLGSPVLSVFDYVVRNLQPGVERPETKGLVVAPLHVLCRGYGEAVECAWVLAALLRSCGVHAVVIRLPPSEKDKPPHRIVGALSDGRLYLFDPYRGVPICRAGDGRIADLQALLSGEQVMDPLFGGPGTPVTLDGLRGATYFVPAHVGNVLPDAWLLSEILRENGRYEVVYRSFRDDLRNIAAAVFGDRAQVKDGFTRLTAQGRGEVVDLWPVPFKVDQRLAKTPGYYDKVTQAHRAAATYLAARQAQLFGEYEAAVSLYDEVLQRHADDVEVVEDVTFLKALAAPKISDRAQRLAGYLKDYPAGLWWPPATLRLAEIEAWRGDKDAALELIARLKPPYDLRAKLLKLAISKGKAQVRWRFPETTAPPPKDKPPNPPR